MHSQIGLEGHWEMESLRLALEEFYPDSSVLVVPDDNALPEVGHCWDVVAIAFYNPSEFPIMLNLIYFSDIGPSAEENICAEQMKLAKFFSRRFNRRTISNGSNHGPTSGPYWSVVWDRGVPWLADDCGTLYGDGEGGPVLLVRPLDSIGDV